MLSLKDRLSHLNFNQACKILKDPKLILKGGTYEINIAEQVELSDQILKLKLNSSTVTIENSEEAAYALRFSCSSCNHHCEHIGAAFSLVLEEKSALGLAIPPELEDEEKNKNLSLLEIELQLRREKSKKEKMQIQSTVASELWSDYLVTNRSSGKTYRVALRGWKQGESYCSCPDFRKNTLGVCKHIYAVENFVRKNFSEKKLAKPYTRKEHCLHLKYGKKPELHFLPAEKIDKKEEKLIKPLLNKPLINLGDVLRRMQKIEALGSSVKIYPDAEEYIQTQLLQTRLTEAGAEILKNKKNHPLLKKLLKTELLPYQLEGIAFAVSKGRAILADDMGLGKTIQGIGTAVLLENLAGIQKTLVICPASLKSQWKLEIEKFSNKDCLMVTGTAQNRAELYGQNQFFTIANYEQVLRDLTLIEKIKWDLIILDEGQRIKNWDTQTSQRVKSLKSKFALVLTGTPLENKLEDLFSVVEFVSEHHLGPSFRFFEKHKILDEKGKLFGYKNMDVLREQLKGILLRRTRKEVLKDLPPRTTEIRKIPATAEQLEIDTAQRRMISSILNKKFISEMDLLRLQKALQACRMAADSTYLVNKQAPGYSSKLTELDQLLEQLLAEENRKIILFSEWTTMLDLIEPLIKKNNAQYVRLDGSVPQKKRQMLVHQFQNDPKTRLFLTSNAGSTGLNLQAANTIINVDLPWNPAVLEQRIARAHRLGQKNPVQIYLLVTEGTLEESLLGTLASKQALATAALDPNSSIRKVDMRGGIEALRKKLEILLGEKPEASIDQSLKNETEQQVKQLQQKKIAEAGGQLFQAAVHLMSELLPQKTNNGTTHLMAQKFEEILLSQTEKDAEGKLKLTLSFPDDKALKQLAEMMGRVNAYLNQSGS